MLYRTTFIICLLFLLTSCDFVEKWLSKEDKQLIDQTVNDARSVIDEGTVEVKKLRQVEYKVLKLPTTSTAKLEHTLNALGQDRWNCFNSQILNAELIVLCKRPVETPLRYLPKALHQGL